ncbi:MAG: surface antigen [Bacteroidetes bacterium]|nr:surface antigen [Bacteroidota bacterium]
MIVFTGCSGLKKIPKDDKLYTGAEIKLVHHGKIKHKTEITSDAKTAVRPQPNAQFLGLRPKLWLYQAAGDGKDKGIRKWMRKQGEAPILISSVKPAETTKFIDAKLFNIGIFNAATEYKIKTKRKTAKVIYICHIHQPYTVQDINYVINNEEINFIIKNEKNRSVVKAGDNYDLEKLKTERERLDEVLKDKGYFYFSPDYLLFKADTISKEKKVSLELSLKDELPDKALEVYRIRNVIINPDYDISEKRDRSDSLRRNRLVVDSVIFTENEMRIKPSAILQSITLRKNDLYSRKKHNATLNRLMTMGTFKFVRIKFTERDSAKELLNMRVMLTPMPKRTLRMEANMVSKSNDFLGPRLTLNYTNRNALNGAELLNIDLGGSFETQISGKYKNLYSYSLNSKVELLFPRFVAPFRIKFDNSSYVPKTKFSVGYNYLKRIAWFDLRSFQFVYGFRWKETISKEHELNPVNINLTSVVNRTPEFNDLLQSNPFIKKSYEEQFIAGLLYSYLYNEQVLTGKRDQFYLNVTAETSGNAFSLFSRSRGEIANEDNPSKIGGIVYSQFGKVSLDIRNYINFKHGKFVQRLFTGVGKPYGNSSTLPYIKQFFSGGPNSIRAFPINSIGPGTYSLQATQASLFLQQGGDIKLEANLEYRFDIFRSLKGAVFSDAGNTWLFKSNPAVTGDPFSFYQFYKEIAVGTGVGLRFDISFFVIRFDLGIPLRKPWLPENERWVLKEIDFSDPTWRSNNLILNVAIGYPF